MFGRSTPGDVTAHFTPSPASVSPFEDGLKSVDVDTLACMPAEVFGWWHIVPGNLSARASVCFSAFFVSQMSFRNFRTLLMFLMHTLISTGLVSIGVELKRRTLFVKIDFVDDCCPPPPNTKNISAVFTVTHSEGEGVDRGGSIQ